MTETERQQINRRVEANVEAWQAVDELRAEVDRLRGILGRIRQFCRTLDESWAINAIYTLAEDFDAP